MKGSWGVFSTGTNQLIEVRSDAGHEVSTGSDSDRVSTFASGEMAITNPVAIAPGTDFTPNKRFQLTPR